MITPDTKDWTWVLERPCEECGFDAVAFPAAAAPTAIRTNANTWQRLLDDGTIRPGRRDDSTWSSLEYACHVRDVYRRYNERIGLMLAEDDPLFPNWDQDEAAVADRYEEQDPAQVVHQLKEAAEALADRLEQVSGTEWERPGRRSDGASFTVATLTRYMVHDPVHHVWDVTTERR